MISNVLFDMDGVLIRSEDIVTRSAILALSEFEISAKTTDFKEFTGMGEDKFVGKVAEKYGKKYIPDMKIRTYEIYDKIANEEVKVDEDVVTLIKKLKADGFKLAIASSADRVKVNINIKVIGLEPSHFDTIITGSDITHTKPHPEIYITAADKLSANANNCIVIEDAISGIISATAAGIKSIGITSAFDEQTLLKAGAITVVDKTYKIYNVINELNLHL